MENRPDIDPIQTDAIDKATLNEMSPLMESDGGPGTPEGSPGHPGHARAGVLSQGFPIGTPDRVGAIKFRMEQSSLPVKDLEPIIGKSNRVHEVLNRKRPRRENRGDSCSAGTVIARRITNDCNVSVMLEVGSASATDTGGKCSGGALAKVHGYSSSIREGASPTCSVITQEFERSQRWRGEYCELTTLNH